MQAGGVATRDVYSISGRILINGQDIGADVKTVTVGRDIPEGLPGSSAAFQAATLEVVADLSPETGSKVQHPWNRAKNWPPAPSDMVEVWLSDGASEWQQIKGNVTEASGDTDSPEVSFTVVDRYPALNRPVNIPALSESMPSLVDANEYRYIGMQSTYITDSVLRQAGRYCTPPMSDGCFVSVPFQGSTWPERGTCTYSVRNQPDETAVSFPSWFTSPYGLKVHNLEARYDPLIWSGQDTVFDQPMEITQEIVDNRGASTFVYVGFAAGQLAIAYTNTHFFARYYPSSGAYTSLVTIPKGDNRRVTARFSLFGNVLTAEVRTLASNGVVSDTTSGTVSILSGDLTGPVTRIRATGAGSQGAFQAAYPRTAWTRIGYQPNAVIHAAASGRNHLVGVPTQINQNAADLLNQQAEAEFASWWIDENDILQWWDRNLLTSRSPVATLTAADHVKQIQWQHDHNALRRAVHVDYQQPTVTQKWRTDLTLWEGNSETYSQGDTDEIIVEAPRDEIWLGVDYENPTPYTLETPNYWVLNRGIRSVMGGIAINVYGEERMTNSVIPTLRRLDDNTFAFGVQVTALATDEQAALQFPQDVSTDTNLYSRWRGKSLPILRGKKKIVLKDARYTAASEGPSTAADLDHSAGWWIQREEFAQQIADHAVPLVTIAQPLIPSLEIMPVFNLQVGDVVTVDDPEVMGISVRALVIGNQITADFTTGQASQSLRLRPLAVTRNGATWEEFGLIKGGTSWQSWAASRPGDSWTNFGSDPLK